MISVLLLTISNKKKRIFVKMDLLLILILLCKYYSKKINELIDGKKYHKR